MTKTPPIVGEAESFVRDLADELIRVRERECLCCYMWRQLDEHSCDGTHRFATHFRDTVAPRATALRERLRRVGACCCDCELFLNGYQPHRRFWTPEHEIEEDGETYLVDAEPPDPLPPCTGVRRGSLQPCGNWVRVRWW